jgi:hypothetical protein
MSVNKHETTTFTCAKQNATKTYNCFGFGNETPARSDAKSKSLDALDVALFLPKPGNVVEPEPVPVRKAVRFAEEPVKPRLFDREAPSGAVKTSLSANRWKPLKRDRTYTGSSVSTGFKTMFQSTSLDTIALKRRVLQRYKAIQEHERRRRQDAIAAGYDNLPLGQREYGNTDYKLSLQLNKRITVDDIGMWVDPSELGIPKSTYNPLNGPLLHFGGFEDEYGRIFENAYIPDMAAAYKEPIDWEDAPGSIEALHEWTYDNFATMQPASYELGERTGSDSDLPYEEVVGTSLNRSAFFY